MTESIKQAMTKRLVTISSESSVYEADQLMKEKRIRHLPVINNDWCLAEQLHKEEEAEASPLNQLKTRAVQTIGDLANRIANIGI